MPELIFEVAGKPITQGSMNPGRNGKMFHKKTLQPWRDLVWEAAVLAIQNSGYMDHVDPDNPPFPIPKSERVHVHCTFAFKKPKSPKYSYPARADLDKLCRAVGDAISVPKPGRTPIITDDDQIVSWSATKIFSSSDGLICTITW